MPHKWSLTNNEIFALIEAWPRPGDGALIVWAIWAVDGLHYLLDLDELAFAVWPRELLGYPEEPVDLAHVRWASASAITALDLCAATIGRRRCDPRADGNEYSLRDFDPSGKKTAEFLLTNLTTAEREWIEAVTTDEQYATALRARNPMVHSRLTRAVYGAVGPVGPHEARTGFPVGPGESIVDSRPLIELCSDVATRHLEDFLDLIAAPDTVEEVAKDE